MGQAKPAPIVLPNYLSSSGIQISCIRHLWKSGESCFLPRGEEESWREEDYPHEDNHLDEMAHLQFGGRRHFHGRLRRRNGSSSYRKG